MLNRVIMYVVLVSFVSTSQVKASENVTRAKVGTLAYNGAMLVGNGMLATAGAIFAYLAFKQTHTDIRSCRGFRGPPSFKKYWWTLRQAGALESGNYFNWQLITPSHYFIPPALLLLCSKLTYDSIKNCAFYAKEIKKSIGDKEK